VLKRLSEQRSNELADRLPRKPGARRLIREFDLPLSHHALEASGALAASRGGKNQPRIFAGSYV